MQEALHVEAVKDRVELEMPALGVAQVKEAGLQTQPDGPHPQGEGAGVVLHLGPGLVRHPLAAQGHVRANAQLAQMAGQGEGFYSVAVPLSEFFRPPPYIAVALLVESAQYVRS